MLLASAPLGGPALLLPVTWLATQMAHIAWSWLATRAPDARPSLSCVTRLSDADGLVDPLTHLDNVLHGLAECLLHPCSVVFHGDELAQLRGAQCLKHLPALVASRHRSAS
jgi:hypothetical protein